MQKPSSSLLMLSLLAGSLADTYKIPDLGSSSSPAFDKKKKQSKERFGDRYRPEDYLYTNVGRNDPCPCGSGKKFKKCCEGKKKQVQG